MIIPVKCFSCGMVLANKCRYFLRRVRQRKMELGQNIEKVAYLTEGGMEKTVEGQILDEIGILRPCCRCAMLTHVDIN